MRKFVLLMIVLVSLAAAFASDSSTKMPKKYSEWLKRDAGYIITNEEKATPNHQLSSSASRKRSLQQPRATLSAPRGASGDLPRLCACSRSLAWDCTTHFAAAREAAQPISVSITAGADGAYWQRWRAFATEANSAIPIEGKARHTRVARPGSTHEVLLRTFATSFRAKARFRMVDLFALRKPTCRAELYGCGIFRPA
jgi:hypothetical protein